MIIAAQQDQQVDVRVRVQLATAVAANGEQGCVAPVKVDNVVDTVGAGDGFAVGLVSALLEGRSLKQAIDRGNKIGSLAIQVQGDSEGLPTRAQLNEG